MIMKEVTVEMIRDYMTHIVEDYARWSGPETNDINTVKGKMFDEFRHGVHYEDGRNYIKVVTRSGSGRSVHSFIVKKETKKFPVGAILKAAGWSAPATNFARGSIFDKSTWTSVTWTGAL